MGINSFRTSASSGMLLDVNLVNVDEVKDALLTQVLKAMAVSLRKGTRALEQNLEAQTRAATKGNAWRAWKSEVYPRDGRPAYDPVGEVFANGGKRSKGMLSYWSLPGTNRAVGNKYLAVPLRAALGTTLGRHISPKNWERRFGAKLRPLFRPGKTPLLVADGAFGPGGFNRPEVAGARRRGGQKVSAVQTIAVFALIEEQPHANRVSIGSARMVAEMVMGQDLAKGIARIT